MAERPTEEAWQPQPFAERKSQHITFGDYFNRTLLKLLVGSALGGAIGWCIDRTLKIQHHGIEPFKWLGGAVGGFIGGYMTWRRNEAPLLQFDQLYQDYHDVPGLLPTNQELATDNALLKRVVAHQREQLPKSQINVAERVNNGTVRPAPQEKDIAAK